MKENHLGSIRPHPGHVVWEISPKLLQRIKNILTIQMLDYLQSPQFAKISMDQIKVAETQFLPTVVHENKIPKGHVRIGAVAEKTAHKKIIWNDGCKYMPALNKKNALKKLLKQMGINAN